MSIKLLNLILIPINIVVIVGMWSLNAEAGAYLAPVGSIILSGVALLLDKIENENK